MAALGESPVEVEEFTPERVERELEEMYRILMKREERRKRRERLKPEIPEYWWYWLFEQMPAFEEALTSHAAKAAEDALLARLESAKAAGQFMDLKKELLPPGAVPGTRVVFLGRLAPRALGRCSAVAAKLGLLLGAASTMCAAGGDHAKMAEEYVNRYLGDFAEMLWHSCGLMVMEDGEVRKKAVDMEPFPVTREGEEVVYEPFTCGRLEDFVMQVEEWFEAQGRYLGELGVKRGEVYVEYEGKRVSYDELRNKYMKLVNKINQARLRYEKLKSFEERGIKLTEEERKELRRLEENLAEWEEKRREMEDTMTVVMQEYMSMSPETLMIGPQLARGYALRHVLYCGKRSFQVGYHLASLRGKLAKYGFPHMTKPIEDALDKLHKFAVDGAAAGCPCFTVMPKLFAGRVPTGLWKLPAKIQELKLKLRRLNREFSERLAELVRQYPDVRSKEAAQAVNQLVKQLIARAYEDISQVEFGKTGEGGFHGCLERYATRPLGIEFAEIPGPGRKPSEKERRARRKYVPVTKEAHLRLERLRLYSLLKRLKAFYTDLKQLKEKPEEVDVGSVKAAARAILRRIPEPVVRSARRKIGEERWEELSKDEEVVADLLRILELKGEDIRENLDEVMKMLKGGIDYIERRYREVDLAWRKMVGKHPPLKKLREISLAPPAPKRKPPFAEEWLEEARERAEKEEWMEEARERIMREAFGPKPKRERITW